MKGPRTVKWKLAGFVLLLVIWEVTARSIGRSIILPTLYEVGTALNGLLQTIQTAGTVWATLKRILLTLLIDSGIAFLCGTAAGFSPRLENLLFPAETVIRSIPTMSVLLLSLIWFNSEITPIVVASLIALPILYRGILDGIRNIDPNLVEMSRVFCVPFFRRLRFFYLPSIMPFLKNAYRGATGLLVKVMITAEVLSQPKRGIGTQLQIARAQLDTASIFAWSIIGIAFAFLLQFACKLLFSASAITEYSQDSCYAD